MAISEMLPDKSLSGHELCKLLTKELYFPLGQELTPGSSTPKHTSHLPDQQGHLHLINNDDNNNLYLSLL